MTPDLVLTRFARQIGPSIDDLRGRGRSAVLSTRRREAMWLLRELCGLTHAQIGAVLGGRTAATVAEALATVDQDRARDPAIATGLAYLRGEVSRDPLPARTGMAPDLCLLAVRSVLTDTRLSSDEARIAALQLIGGAHA